MQVPLHIDFYVVSAVGAGQIKGSLECTVLVSRVGTRGPGSVATAVPCSVLNSVVIVIDIVNEPTWALILRARVCPDVESELDFASIRNISYRTHRYVAGNPTTVNRRSEDWDCS